MQETQAETQSLRERDRYLFPRELFEGPPDPAGWTCVRSRPRWEKKLAGYLQANHVEYYLPVAARQTFSGRKHRTAWHPLFPGFVFVKGSHAKQAFKQSGCVVYVLRPASRSQSYLLDQQIRAVRRLLMEELPAELTNEYRLGERVTIASGPLQGIEGMVVATANGSRLVVRVDMLGVGVSVVLGSDVRLERQGAPPRARIGSIA